MLDRTVFCIFQGAVLAVPGAGVCGGGRHLRHLQYNRAARQVGGEPDLLPRGGGGEEDQGRPQPRPERSSSGLQLTPDENQDGAS